MASTNFVDHETVIPASWLNDVDDVCYKAANRINGAVDREQLDFNADWTTVKSFGATGDGVTDDTEAIQAALDEGGTIYFPAGTYIISDTLNITVDGTRLIGWGATIEHLSTGTSDIIYAEDLYNVDIIGFNINGRKDLKSTTGEDVARGIVFWGMQRSRILWNTIHNVYNHGVRSGQLSGSPDASSDIELIGNFVYDCGTIDNNWRGLGFFLFGNHDRIVIAENTILNCIGGGIGVDDTSAGVTGQENFYFSFTNNVIYSDAAEITDKTTMGIWLGGNRQFTVTGNSVFGYRFAIYVEDSQANVISGWASITGNYFEGLACAAYLADVQNLLFSQNTCVSRTNTTDSIGILISSREPSVGANNCLNVNVQGNQVYALRQGIYATGATPWDTYTAISDDVHISDNDIVCLTASATSNSDGIRCAQQTNLKIHSNRVKNHYNGIRIGVDASTGALVKNNVSVDNENSGYLVTGPGAMFVDNTSYGNSTAGMEFSGTADAASTKFYFNSFMDTVGSTGTHASITQSNNIGL
jgi:parallel beta-helix repeat protein